MGVVPANKQGINVLEGAFRNAYRKFPNQKDARYFEGFLIPHVEATFKMGKQESVFTIGSCFARNVEDVLITRGIKVPTAHFTVPQEEVHGRSNQALNQYNPGTMLQCVRAINGGVPVGSIFPHGEAGVIDGLISTGSRAVTVERAAERRTQIVDLYKTGLAASNFVVITLGLIEVWIDHQTGYFLNDTPPRAVLQKEPSRFEFRRLNVPESMNLVSQLVEVLQADRNRKIVMTVSPVPLQATFCPQDAVTANGYSKSVLRIVAQEITNNFSGVDYFPSYDIVMSQGLRSFGTDNVHVYPAVVDRVISYMVKQYLDV